jgi:hypothetical protein
MNVQPVGVVAHSEALACKEHEQAAGFLNEEYKTLLVLRLRTH